MSKISRTRYNNIKMTCLVSSRVESPKNGFSKEDNIS